MDRRDAEASQLRRRANARKQQDVGRADCTGAEDYLIALGDELFASALHLSSDCFLALEYDAVDGAVGPQGEVQAVPGHVEVAQGRAPADAVGVVDRAGTDPRCVGKVVVRAVWDADGPAGIVKRLLVGQGLIGLEPAHDYGTVGVVEVVAAEVGVGLDHAEVLQQVLEAPLVVAQSGPGVVVLGNAPQEDLAVDGAGAAGDLAPGHQHRFGMFGGLAGELPVVVAGHYVGAGGVAELDLFRQMLEVGVVRPGFEQKHRAGRVFAQPRGYNGPGGT